MNSETKLYTQGLEKYPKTTIIFGNLLMIVWIILGTIACRFLCSLAAWLYLAFAIIMVYIVLRKLICTDCCYYDKWCPIGWSKLSALFFKKGSVKKFGTNIGVKLAPFTYGVLSLIPLIFIIASMFQKFTISKLIVLVLLLVISFYSGGIGRKKSCAKCKMRLICPGCAVKPPSDA